jgi:hypothetical protein
VAEHVEYVQFMSLLYDFYALRFDQIDRTTPPGDPTCSLLYCIMVICPPDSYSKVIRHCVVQCGTRAFFVFVGTSYVSICLSQDHVDCCSCVKHGFVINGLAIDPLLWPTGVS